jgi:hypothetical protein
MRQILLFIAGAAAGAAVARGADVKPVAATLAASGSASSGGRTSATFTLRVDDPRAARASSYVSLDVIEARDDTGRALAHRAEDPRPGDDAAGPAARPIQSKWDRVRKNDDGRSLLVTVHLEPPDAAAERIDIIRGRVGLQVADDIRDLFIPLTPGLPARVVEDEGLRRAGLVATIDTSQFAPDDERGVIALVVTGDPTRLADAVLVDPATEIPPHKNVVYARDECRVRWSGAVGPDAGLRLSVAGASKTETLEFEIRGVPLRGPADRAALEGAPVFRPLPSRAREADGRTWTVVRARLLGGAASAVGYALSNVQALDNAGRALDVAPGTPGPGGGGFTSVLAQGARLRRLEGGPLLTLEIPVAAPAGAGPPATVKGELRLRVPKKVAEISLPTAAGASEPVALGTGLKATLRSVAPAEEDRPGRVEIALEGDASILGRAWVGRRPAWPPAPVDLTGEPGRATLVLVGDATPEDAARLGFAEETEEIAVPFELPIAP